MPLTHGCKATFINFSRSLVSRACFMLCRCYDSKIRLALRLHNNCEMCKRKQKCVSALEGKSCRFADVLRRFPRGLEQRTSSFIVDTARPKRRNIIFYSAEHLFNYNWMKEDDKS